MDHAQEQKINEASFFKILSQLRPDIHLIMETLDNTNIQAEIVYQTLLAIELIAGSGGSHFGHVTIDIQDNKVLFIRGENSRKLAINVYKDNEQ